MFNLSELSDDDNTTSVATTKTMKNCYNSNLSSSNSHAKGKQPNIRSASPNFGSDLSIAGSDLAVLTGSSLPTAGASPRKNQVTY